MVGPANRVLNRDHLITEPDFRRSDSLQDFVDLLPRAFRQDYQKLVSADSDGHVAGADRALQSSREFLQGGIASGVSELIVDLLEIVEIEQKHRQRIAVAFRSREFFLQALFAEPPIVEAGQRIKNRQVI